MLNQPDPTYSSLPGTETQTPAQDELEARRFPQFQAPVPRIPGIPAPRVAKPAKAAGGGGLNMDTLMPLLLMAAPFLEAHQPGYGLGLVQGVLQHQDEVAQARQNEILTFAKEFANTPDEHWPAVAALLKAHGVDADRIATIKASREAFRGPDYAVNQQISQARELLAPEVAQSAVTGRPFDPTQMTPARFREVQGALPGYQLQTTVPGQAAIPGGGELGTRTAPVAVIPPQERVVRRGEIPPPTYGSIFEKTRGTPFENAPMPTDARGVVNIKEASANMESLGLYEDPAKHKANYQAYLRAKMEDAVNNPGSRDLATLKAQMESPGAGMVFNTELRRAQDAAAKADFARPVFVQIGGQMMPVSRDKAATIAQDNAGAVIVPVNGTMVRFNTGAEFANYVLAAKRLAREESNQPPSYTLNGVKIRNEADYKTAVLLHLLPMPTDPTARRLLLGSDPGTINAQQATTELRKVQAQIAYYQPIRGMYPKPVQAAIDAFISGGPAYTQQMQDTLNRDQTKAGPNQLRAVDVALALAGFNKQAQEWQRWVTQPDGATPAGPVGTAPPVPAGQFAGQTIQGPDGSKWQSDGTAWTQVP